jgi:hypothetical protein
VVLVSSNSCISFASQCLHANLSSMSSLPLILLADDIRYRFADRREIKICVVARVLLPSNQFSLSCIRLVVLMLFMKAVYFRTNICCLMFYCFFYSYQVVQDDHYDAPDQFAQAPATRSENDYTTICIHIFHLHP